MLYTRKGDDGTTKTFGCDQRISKSSIIAEALGSLDEINSFLGLCKVRAQKEELKILKNTRVSEILLEVQKNLFIIQAELAGASMSIDDNKVKSLENIIDWVEAELPPIKTFFISGGTELASLFDVARTIARRAERRVFAVIEEEKHDTRKDRLEISQGTKAYLNRLSSLLYALARYSNHKAGISEQSPDYK